MLSNYNKKLFVWTTEENYHKIPKSTESTRKQMYFESTEESISPAPDQCETRIIQCLPEIPFPIQQI